MVGRIEDRKNQLTLAFALRELPYPLVVVGHNDVADYLKLVKAISGPNVHFIGRLEPNSEMLASAFRRQGVLPAELVGGGAARGS